MKIAKQLQFFPGEQLIGKPKTCNVCGSEFSKPGFTAGVEINSDFRLDFNFCDYACCIEFREDPNSDQYIAVLIEKVLRGKAGKSLTKK